jgi:hypothetical protein
LLEQEGKLSINDDVRKYIPEVPDFGKVITLNHILHHTSGLRDQWNLLALSGWRLDDIITTDQILRLVSRQKELNFNPEGSLQPEVPTGPILSPKQINLSKKILFDTGQSDLFLNAKKITGKKNVYDIMGRFQLKSLTCN